MKCLDDESTRKLQLIGNFNTDKAQNIMIVFERCDSKDPSNECAGDQEYE